jgi:hypothetical protein
MRDFAERGFRVADDGNGFCAASARIPDGGDGERCASAGSDAYDDISLGWLLLRDGFAAQFAGVFIGFYGYTQRFWASRDDELDHARGDIESRRTLDGVKGGDASAGPGTYVDEAAALGERCEDQVDPLCDRPQSALHGGSDFGIFTVDDAGDFERGLAIEIGGGRVCFLGAEAAEFYPLYSAVQGFALRSVSFQSFFPKASITAS